MVAAMKSEMSTTAGWSRSVTLRVELAARASMRRPRSKVPWLSPTTVAVVAAGFVTVFMMLMALLDARAIIWARGLPPGVIATFREITDFGKAGWFLYPLAVLMIVLVLMPLRLPRAAQATLAVMFGRVAFLFLAIGIPYWFNAVLKQIIGRARPFVGGSANPYLFRPFSWGPEYASLPSNHAVTVCAAAIAIGAL